MGSGLQPDVKCPPMRLTAAQQFAIALNEGDATKFGKNETLELKNIRERFAGEIEQVALAPKSALGETSDHILDPKAGLHFIRREDGTLTFMSTFSSLGGTGMHGVSRLGVRQAVEADGREFKKYLNPKRGKDATGLLGAISALDGRKETSDLEAGILYLIASLPPRGEVSGNLLNDIDETAIRRLHRATSNGMITQEKISYMFANTPLAIAYGRLLYDNIADPASKEPVAGKF
jgi:hypothetical protein